MKHFCNMAVLALAAAATPIHAADTASRLDSPAATTTLQIIDREMIERSGKFSLAEVLRDLPLNSAGSFRPQSASTAQSYAGVDLRGLGEERTLVLVNGRREAIDPSTSAASNLNLIPLAMVERIEILPSGAGAMHGMNAMGGVINIVTRDDFRGVEASAGTSWTERAGGEVEGASVLAGIGYERGSIVVGASYDERDIVFVGNRPRFSGDVVPLPGVGSIFSNNFLTGGFSFLTGQGPNGGAGNVPGCQGEGFSLTLSGLCLYDTRVGLANDVQTRNESLFANARYRIDDNWALALDARASRLESFSSFTSTPSSPWPANGFGAILLEPGSPNHPATPPSAGGLNPLWQDYEEVAGWNLLNAHRFAANGPRESTTQAVSYSVALALEGRIGNFDVSLSAQRAEVQHEERNDNLILSELAQAAIDTGAYNLYDPFGTPDEVLESFEVTGSRDANYLLRSLQGTISTDLFELPGGTSRVLFGAELRDEDFDDRPDALQDAGRITVTAANPSFGERELWAVFGELTFPVTDRLDAMAAVRWDDYDYTASGASARMALDWRPMEQLGFSAAWSRSLRAEPLRQNPSPFSSGFSTGFIDPLCTDPGPLGCPSIGFEQFRVRNPDLGPEVAEQIDLGLRFSPLDGVELALNAFDVQIDDRYAFIGDQLIANCVAGVASNCPDGLRALDPIDMPPDTDSGLGVARDASGRILYIQSGLVGFGTLETRGIDGRLSGTWQFGGLNLSSAIDLTWTDRYRIDGGSDLAGDYGFPEWRGRWQTSADWNDLALAWIINHIAGQDQSAAFAGSLPSWTTHDVQLRWAAPWNADIAVGVDNLADRDPVFDIGEGRGFNFDLYDDYGRLGYLRYTQRF